MSDRSSAFHTLKMGIDGILAVFRVSIHEYYHSSDEWSKSGTNYEFVQITSARSERVMSTTSNEYQILTTSHENGSMSGYLRGKLPGFTFLSQRTIKQNYFVP